VDVNELSTKAVRAFLDMPEGGEKEVEPYSDAVLTEYFGEYSPTAKSFFITGGRSEAFKEFTGVVPYGAGSVRESGDDHWGL
jgi:hypothetical protein